MDQQSQQNDSLPSEQAEHEVVGLIRKMQQQLISLEKKVDILINQSQARPRSFSDKSFSKPPFKSFSPHSRPDRGHHFGKQYGGEKKSFDPKKKPFYFNRKDK